MGCRFFCMCCWYCSADLDRVLSPGTGSRKLYFRFQVTNIGGEGLIMISLYVIVSFPVRYNRRSSSVVSAI
jgi:hypothetical protein